MFKRKVVPVVLALAVSLLTRCRILGFGIGATVGVAGLAGYAVYKTGDAVVTGVGFLTYCETISQSLSALTVTLKRSAPGMCEPY